jgi:YggT family protein
LNPTIATIFTAFIWFLIAAIIIRSLLSWFPGMQNNSLSRLLYQVTEPILDPIRRIMPRTGMIDLSAMVAIILLYVMLAVVSQASS